MSAPDDENSKHQMYAPKRIREQPRIPAASPMRVDSPATSPSHAQLEDDRRSHSVRGDLAEEERRRVYEPEPIQPLSSRREYSWLRLINWIAIAVACTALIVIIGTVTKPLWETWVTQPPLQASRLSDRFAMGNTPAGHCHWSCGIVWSAAVEQRAGTAGSGSTARAKFHQHSRSGGN